MKRLSVWLGLLALGAALFLVFTPAVTGQPTGWLSYVLQDPQAVVQFRVFGSYGAPGFIGQGTALPTIANAGQGPMNGETFVVRDNASAVEPVQAFYSGASTAWRANAISTLATNAPDVANSVWFGTNQIIFESTTANALETIITAADTLTGDVTMTIPIDNAQWAGAGTFMMSVLATNAPDAANSVWGVSNGIHYEGATQDGWENSIQTVDPTVADGVFNLPNNANAGPFVFIWSDLATNALDIANSVWFTTNGMVYEGTLDGLEMTLLAEDATADLLHSIVDHNYGTAGYNGTELDYHVLSTPEIHAASGYFSIPPLFTHSEDVVHDSTTGNDGMYVYRMYLPHPLTVSDASVLLVDGAALAVGDIVGIAIYEDANAGIQLTEGTGDGTAAGLETVALADVTLHPGFYRFAICSSDATNMHFAGTLFDDEHIDLVAGIAGDILYGLATNPCVTGDPPATTGALLTDDEAIPFVVFH